MVDLDKRSSVRNLCPWPVSFRLHTSGAEVLINPGEKTLLNNQEIALLCENGNIMFVGTGNGNHARVYIENPELRKYVGFESDDGKERQFILDNEVCKKIFEYKTLSTFKQHVEKAVVYDHEKHIIMDYARKNKINDFDKIDFLQNFTGLKFKID